MHQAYRNKSTSPLREVIAPLMLISQTTIAQEDQVKGLVDGKGGSLCDLVTGEIPLLNTKSVQTEPASLSEPKADPNSNDASE